MPYIGVDHLIGLDCSQCKHTIRIRYSQFLRLCMRQESVACNGCGRTTNHGWRNASQVRFLVAERMRADCASRAL